MICESHGCDQSAAWAVFWPGQLTYQCKPHADRAHAAAAAMGFELQVVPFSSSLLPLDEGDR